jgi:hypothetical protein
MRDGLDSSDAGKTWRCAFALALLATLAVGCELVVVDESVKADFDGGAMCAALCGGACVDIQNDTSNCGRCGNRCDSAASELCISGSCISSTCEGDLVWCGTGCVDVATSALHCSECSRPCDGECVDGTCTGDICGVGDLVCPGVGCVNPRSRSHCGGCGNACAADEVCADGRCEPDVCGGTGEVDCGDGCVDLQASADHCGSCGNACSGPCFDGDCGTGCESGQTECAPGACFDLQTDFTSCGACGNVCDPGVQCVEGSCECPFSEACGVCASPHHQEHCGMCGSACADNERCFGTCVELPPLIGPACNRDGSWCPVPALQILPDPLLGGGLLLAGTVLCPDTLTEAVATVACRQQGYAAGRLVAGVSTGIRRTGARTATCLGTEDNLNYCTFVIATTCRYDPLLVACSTMLVMP